MMHKLNRKANSYLWKLFLKNYLPTTVHTIPRVRKPFQNNEKKTFPLFHCNNKNFFYNCKMTQIFAFHLIIEFCRILWKMHEIECWKIFIDFCMKSFFVEFNFIEHYLSMENSIKILNGNIIVNGVFRIFLQISYLVLLNYKERLFCLTSIYHTFFNGAFKYWTLLFWYVHLSWFDLCISIKFECLETKRKLMLDLKFLKERIDCVENNTIPYVHIIHKSSVENTSFLK
jgi:hypothetical protein